jgi:hypothetical protein
MIVNRKTRNINGHLTHLSVGDEYFVGLPVNATSVEMLQRLGFEIPVQNGQSILPSAKRGAASRRNADGFDVVHRDQPKETKYRQISWSWTEHHGRDKVEKTGVKDVPYLRYPRTRMPPYSVEMQVRTRSDGATFLVSGPFKVQTELDVVATNTANVFREQLDGFEILTSKLETWIASPIRRLNWDLLPAGQNPWASAKAAVSRIVESAAPGNRPVIAERFAAIGRYEPEFVAVGREGFDGYVVFGFPQYGFCLLENKHVNNATYVLAESSWVTVSQLTKAEILAAGIHRARLIHTRSWFDELDALMGSGKRRAA